MFNADGPTTIPAKISPTMEGMGVFRNKTGITNTRISMVANTIIGSSSGNWIGFIFNLQK
jgi:hypothetical protein